MPTIRFLADDPTRGETVRSFDPYITWSRFAGLNPSRRGRYLETLLRYWLTRRLHDADKAYYGRR